MEVLVLKKNGKVKLVENQFDLKKLKKDDVTTLMFPVGEYNSVYKSMDPKSNWIKPIVSIKIRYKISFIQDMDIVSCVDNDIIGDSDGSVKVSFTDIMDFISFIVSLEKVAAFNLLRKGEYFNSIVMFKEFYMEYEPVKGEKRIFNMNDYCEENKVLASFMMDDYKQIPTLIKALQHFFGDLDKEVNFTHPYTDKNPIYISPKIKEWDTKPHDNWMTVVKLIQTGTVTFIRYDLMQFLQKMKYWGHVNVASYTILCAADSVDYEDDLSYDEITTRVDTFDVSSNFVYKLFTPSDIIEAAVMAPYYVASMRRVIHLSPLEMLSNDRHTDDDVVLQIKLYHSKESPERELDPYPMKFIMYDEEVDMIDTDQSINEFINTLFLWVKEPDYPDFYTTFDLDEEVRPF